MKIPILLLISTSAMMQAGVAAIDGGVHQPEVPMWVTAGLLCVVAYFMRSIHQDIKSLTARFDNHAEMIPGRYATRSDVEKVRAELHERMNRCAECNRRDQRPIPPLIGGL